MCCDLSVFGRAFAALSFLVKSILAETKNNRPTDHEQRNSKGTQVDVNCSMVSYGVHYKREYDGAKRARVG